METLAPYKICGSKHSMKRLFLNILLLLAVNASRAQSIGIGTASPDNTALLELNSNSKGILIPRITIAERDLIQNPAKGLMVFIIDDSCFHFNAGTAASPQWTALLSKRNGWSTSGNSGTDPNQNFLGTTDNKPLVFKVNNIPAGKLHPEGNIFLGNFAGQGSTGFNNIAIGNNAFRTTTSSVGNIALGPFALRDNTTGSSNLAIGPSALTENTTGFYNVALGQLTLFDNTSGYQNIAIGVGALMNNETGAMNTVSGYDGMKNNTGGNQNTATGRWALLENTFGDFNTANGGFALSNNLTGNSNAGLGYHSNVSTGQLTNATAIGSRAVVACSNCLVLGSINGQNGATADVNVGIGTPNPGAKLDVAGMARVDSLKIISATNNTDPFVIAQLISAPDQIQGNGNLGNSTTTMGWQSFTAGRSGILDSVGLQFFNDVGTSARTLKIYAGEGITGSLLATVTLTPIPEFSTWSYSSYINIPVIAGNKYTIWLSNNFHWTCYSGTGDIYPNGIPDPAMPGDRTFKTMVTSQDSLFKVDKTGTTKINALQLSNGAVNNYVLTSDALGNASWQVEKDPSNRWDLLNGNIYNNNNGRVGIGTSTPSEKFVVKTDTHNYGMIHSNGEITVGTYVGGNSIFGGWIGTKSNHPLMFFTGNGSPQITLLQNGDVGIGTTSPGFRLHVNGLVGATSYVSLSDARLKKDILPIRNALSTVLRMNGASYNWNSDANPDFQLDNRRQLGFLAQEIEKLVPELVVTREDGYKTVNYLEIIPLLVESIKEQQKQIETLNRRIEKMEKK
jgi:hypothetical protein